MKKVLSVLMCLCLILSTITVSVVSVNAETYEDFEYQLIDDDTAEITNYKGSATELVIPSEIDDKIIISIGYRAFSNCTSLISVTVPDSVISIEGYAFSNCYSLTNVENSISITNIHYCAFENCYSLTNITIPNSVTSIGDCAFYNCYSLTNITIPYSVTSIGEDAFSDCDSLTNITVDSDNENYSSVDGVLFNKDKTKLIQYPAGKTTTSYTIPITVTSISRRAFFWCLSLTSITLPDSVTSIGYQAFLGCISLTNLTIPDSVKSIGYQAFNDTGYYNDKSNWENDVLYLDNCLIGVKKDISGDYEIKAGTRVIANVAFSECTSLISVTIPSSITSIVDRMFASCTSLTNVTIPNSVTSIGGHAFFWCLSLTSITLPDSVTNIDSDAFDHTGYYNDLGNWENGILYIGNFLIKVRSGYWEEWYDEEDNCWKDGYIPGIEGDYEIKAGTRVIANDAFSECTSLTSITIPNSITSISEGAFSSCISLTSVTIPDSVTSIGRHAFSGCISLTSVTIPSSVSSIGKFAFSYALIIYGYSNTEAERYANENDIEFVSIGIATEQPTKPTTQPTTKPTDSTTQLTTKPAVCIHNTVVKNVKKATYFAKGYSGDAVCIKCGITTINGKKTNKLTLKTPKLKLTKGKKQFKVKYTAVSGATGFQVRYKAKGKWKTKTFNTVKSATKAIKKLKKGTYKVQVRAFVKQGKQKAFSKWSKTQKVKVK